MTLSNMLEIRLYRVEPRNNMTPNRSMESSGIRKGSVVAAIKEFERKMAMQSVEKNKSLAEEEVCISLHVLIHTHMCMRLRTHLYSYNYIHCIICMFLKNIITFVFLEYSYCYHFIVLIY